MTQERLIEIETDILAKNDRYADANRAILADREILTLNLVSSPGSGKTTLLCKTIEALGDQPLAVIEGDQQTANDADRIRATGAKAVQVNTDNQIVRRNRLNLLHRIVTVLGQVADLTKIG